MKRIFTAFIFLMTTLAWAQPQAVTWSTSYENTDEHTIITVHAEIAEGWHLYSQNLDEGGPIPTSFVLEEDSSFTTVGGWAEG